MLIPLLIGIVLALAVAGYATLARLDRSRAFYPTVLIVIASTYVLFALIGESREALVADLAVMLVFVGLATVGHARSQWLVVLGLAAHGVMDAFHGHVIYNPGVPEWWPAFCAGYDVAAALVLALLIVSRRHRSAAAMKAT